MKTYTYVFILALLMLFITQLVNAKEKYVKHNHLDQCLLERDSQVNFLKSRVISLSDSISMLKDEITTLNHKNELIIEKTDGRWEMFKILIPVCFALVVFFAGYSAISTNRIAKNTETTAKNTTSAIFNEQFGSVKSRIDHMEQQAQVKMEAIKNEAQDFLQSIKTESEAKLEEIESYRTTASIMNSETTKNIAAEIAKSMREEEQGNSRNNT